MREERVVEKVTEWKPIFRRTRGSSKCRWEELVIEESTMEGKNSGSEVMEENHKRGKDEHVIRIGMKENVM